MHLAGQVGFNDNCWGSFMWNIGMVTGVPAMVESRDHFALIKMVSTKFMSDMHRQLQLNVQCKGLCRVNFFF